MNYFEMSFSEIVRELNVGMVIKDFTVISTGTEEQLKARADLLAAHTVLIKINGINSLGITMSTVAEDGVLLPLLKLNFITTKDGQLFSHSDATVVSDSVLLAYTDIRKKLFNWNYNNTFAEILKSYDYEVFK